jgi:adenylate kinase
LVADPAAPTLDVVLLGPVGAGKGTQARRLARIYHLLHLSSGDLLRDEVRHGTPLGKEAETYMANGDLVPDELVVAMVLQRMRAPDGHAGALLDGFPRTLVQAEALDRALAEGGRRLTRALYLSVPEKVLLDRLAHRWTCPIDGTTYDDRVNPPRTPGICDSDGAKLYQRPDDQPQVVAERIRVYLRNTAPVIDYYRARSILVEVDGARDIDTVTADLTRAIQAAVEVHF